MRLPSNDWCDVERHSIAPYDRWRWGFAHSIASGCGLRADVGMRGADWIQNNRMAGRIECSTFVLQSNFASGPTMSTTTIRIPEDLKARVAAAAERAGKTSHSFILEAIAEKAEQAERRADFHAEAEKRYARLVATGKTIPWEKMREYLEGKITGKVTGKAAVRPAAKKRAS
jgi:predicted transcriptional regulator